MCVCVCVCGSVFYGTTQDRVIFRGTAVVFPSTRVSRMREQTGVDWLGLGICCREEEAEVVVGVGGRGGSSVCWLLCAACLIWREHLMQDGGMLQSADGKNRVVCVCVCVIRCEMLGAALCSLKGFGCRPAPCSSSSVLHVSLSPVFLPSSSVLSSLSEPLSLLLFSSLPLSCTILTSLHYRNKMLLCAGGPGGRRNMGNKDGGGAFISQG